MTTSSPPPAGRGALPVVRPRPPSVPLPSARPPTPGPATAAELAELAKKLHSKTDTLNESLLEAESAIHDLKLGVTAFVRLQTWEDPQSTICTYTDLRFGKYDGKWQLLIDTGEEGDDDCRTCHVTKASREVRVVAAQSLQKLLDEMRTAIRVESAEVDNAVFDARAFAHALRGKEADDGIPF